MTHFRKLGAEVVLLLCRGGWARRLGLFRMLRSLSLCLYSVWSGGLHGVVRRGVFQSHVVIISGFVQGWTRSLGPRLPRKSPAPRRRTTELPAEKPPKTAAKSAKTAQPDIQKQAIIRLIYLQRWVCSGLAALKHICLFYSRLCFRLPRSVYIYISFWQDDRFSRFQGLWYKTSGTCWK